jgi:hypothetical protein
MLAATQVQLAVSDFIPLAVGFFGLGTGYLIYGPQELFKFPARDRAVDLSTGIWGVWMPGFMQFLVGIWLWAGLGIFHTYREKPLYMAALAFTAYGVHWFALGLGRAFGADARPNGFMSIAFISISVLGAVVFFKSSDAPVGGLFIGLTGVYASELVASLAPKRTVAAPGGPEREEPSPLGELGERALGFFHLGTGIWLMYLTWAVTLAATGVTERLPF